jgi:hypothetical protein
MDIIDNNIKIVKFLGYNIYKDLVKGDKKCILYDTINDLYTDELDFHKDWNLLMKVVEYIETIDLSKYSYTWISERDDDKDNVENNFCGIRVEIEQNRCWIYVEHQLDPFTTLNVKTHAKIHNNKIDSVYESVVEFVIWLEDFLNKDRS